MSPKGRLLTGDKLFLLDFVSTDADFTRTPLPSPKASSKTR